MNLKTIRARAARELGIPWNEFQWLTPAELSEIAKDYQEQKENEQKVIDYRMAQLQVTLCRCHGDEKSKIEDFLPKRQENNESGDFEKEKKAELSRIHSIFSGIAIRRKVNGD